MIFALALKLLMFNKLNELEPCWHKTLPFSVTNFAKMLQLWQNLNCLAILRRFCKIMNLFGIYLMQLGKF